MHNHFMLRQAIYLALNDISYTPDSRDRARLIEAIANRVEALPILSMRT